MLRGCEGMFASCIECLDEWYWYSLQAQFQHSWKCREMSAQLKNLDVQRFLMIWAPILLDRGCQYLANEKTGPYQEPSYDTS
jgi:hypothetical protein